MNRLAPKFLKVASPRYLRHYAPTRIGLKTQPPGGMTLREFIERCKIQSRDPIRKTQRSSTATTVPANPRALRGTFRVWENFFADVERFFEPSLNRRFPSLTFDQRRWDRVNRRQLGDESSIRDLAISVLEDPCAQIIDALYGTDSVAMFRGPRSLVNIGDPDRVLSFLRPGPPETEDLYKPRVVIEEKTPWALPMKHVDLVSEVNRNRSDANSPYVKAVHQLYGYMSMNLLKYGILTTIESTRVFRRVYDEAHPQGLLECSPEIDREGHLLKSPLAAYAFIASLSFREGFMHISLDPDWDMPKGALVLQLEYGTTLTTPIPGLILGKKEGLSAEKLRLRIEDAVGSRGCYAYTARGKAFAAKKDPETGISVIIKIYDLYNPEAASRYKNEQEIYNRLSELQGIYIPRLYVSGMDQGGGFGILALEDCGENIDHGWLKGTKELGRRALSEIHRLGVLHRDIGFRNFTYNRADTSYPLRIIDFGEATLDPKAVTRDAKESELQKLEQLKLGD
ncbi:hypothetical protein TWF281_008853 [Arthrobotrys megalospora]